MTSWFQDVINVRLTNLINEILRAQGASVGSNYDRQAGLSFSRIHWLVYSGTTPYRQTHHPTRAGRLPLRYHRIHTNRAYNMWSIKFTGYCSTPLLLLLQPNLHLATSTDSNASTLPFKAYEPSVELKDRVSRSVYIEVPYTVETGEAERIAVDWTSRGGGSGTSCESFTFLKKGQDLLCSFAC